MTETDPHGTDPHQAGAKLDAGKIRAALVLSRFPRALWKVCEVGTFGANKYTDDGWLSVPNGQARYADAETRHQLKTWMGEELDPDSKLMHQAHKCWNALAELELLLREREKQNVTQQAVAR